MQWLRGVAVSEGAVTSSGGGDGANGKGELKELRVDVSSMMGSGAKGSDGNFGANNANGAAGGDDTTGLRGGAARYSGPIGLRGGAPEYGGGAAGNGGGASGSSGAARNGGGAANFGADVESELHDMQESLDGKQPVPLSRTFAGGAAKRALLISAGLMATQQLSGINAVVFYTEDLFEAAASALESRFSVMVVGAVQLVATVCSVLVIDRLGRRLLMLISNGAMAVCTLLLGFYFFYRYAAC